jgi:integrase/recombinase XerD
MKSNRNGQAAVLTDAQMAKIRDRLESPHHRLIFDIARHTGERIGAIVQLRVRDVYGHGKPLDKITFPRATRKGKQGTRQVPINDSLAMALSAYKPAGAAEYLFPGAGKSGHIERRAFDFALRRACQLAGINGVSTHSFRRTACTKMINSGLSVPVVKAFFGWANANQVIRYTQVTDGQLAAAADLL